MYRTVHQCCNSNIVETYLFAKLWLSNGFCIFAYLALVAQRRDYMLQYLYVSRLWICDWFLNCCWPSPTQWFLILSPTGLMIIFSYLTALGAFRTTGSWPVARYGEVTMTCGESDWQRLRHNEPDCHADITCACVPVGMATVFQMKHWARSSLSNSWLRGLVPSYCLILTCPQEQQWE